MSVVFRNGIAPLRSNLRCKARRVDNFRRAEQAELAKAFGQSFVPDVSDLELANGSVAVDQVDEAPFGNVTNHQLRHRGEASLRVERTGEDVAGFCQDLETMGGVRFGVIQPVAPALFLDPLARGDQFLFEPSEHVAAVFERAPGGVQDAAKRAVVLAVEIVPDCCAVVGCEITHVDSLGWWFKIAKAFRRTRCKDPRRNGTPVGKPVCGPRKSRCEPQKEHTLTRPHFPGENRIVSSYSIAIPLTLGYSSVGQSTLIVGDFRRQSVEQAAKLTVDTTEALREIRLKWLARVIHDFRGPLFAARGYTKLIAEGRAGDVTDTQSEYLQHIIDNLKKISLLVDTLTELPSDHTLQLDVVDMADILRSCAAEWRNREQTLQIAIDASEERVLTIADRGKLTEAVHKLLGCAVDFSRSGGEVQLQARQEDDEFTLRIAATGAPSAAASPETLTTGIISACDILRLHGGSAHIATSPEGRCHVTVRLPLVNSEFFQEGAGR